MKTITSKINYWALCAFVFFGNGVTALAQNAATTINDAFTSGINQIQQRAQTIVLIAGIIVGLSGAISIAWAIMDRKNSQEGANQRLLNIGIGLVIAFVMLMALSYYLGRVRIS